MGIGRYLIAVSCGAVAFVPVAFAARSVRRRFLPDVSAPTAVLAEIILSLTLVVCVSELLGSIGLFRLAPITVALACAGAIVWWFTKSATAPVPQHPAPEAATRVSWLDRAAALAAVAMVGAVWTMRVADSFQRGMIATADTVWYHMPVAARFAQTGWTPWLHYSDGNSLTVFFPANGELVHALGILFVGNDLLSPLVNVFWLGLALLAAWCIGKRFGVAPVTLIGVAAVLGTPELILDDAGSALTDVASIALLLSAIALVIDAKTSHDREPERQELLVCAALAAGLALGTKYTVIPAVGVLSIAVVVLSRRGTRLRWAALWAAGLALTGSYWYLRNLFAAGSPLPSLNAGIGPLRLPHVPFPNAKVADYLFDGRAWNDYLRPGLRTALGPAWWALVALALGGLALGVLRGPSRVTRSMAIVGIAAFVAFLYSPQILTLGRNPIYFVVNVRYVAPALAIGIVIIAVVASRFGRPVRTALLVSLGAVLVATQFDGSLWHNRGTFIAQPVADSSARAWGLAVGILVAVAGVAGLAYAQRLRHSRALAVAVLSTTLAAALAGGFALEQSYLSNRYGGASVMPRILRWARDTKDARIAIVGFFAQYPLYGNDLSNYVQYVAHRAPDRHSARITTCPAWRRAINDGDYGYVIVTNPGFPFPSRQPALEADWTRSDPAAHLMFEDSNLIEQANVRTHAWLFKINGKLNPAGCAPSAPPQAKDRPPP